MSYYLVSGPKEHVRKFHVFASMAMSIDFKKSGDQSECLYECDEKDEYKLKNMAICEKVTLEKVTGSQVTTIDAMCIEMIKDRELIVRWILEEHASVTGKAITRCKVAITRDAPLLKVLKAEQEHEQDDEGEEEQECACHTMDSGKRCRFCLEAAAHLLGELVARYPRE